MQTSNWCLELKHLGLRTFCAPLRECEAVTHIYKLCRGTLFVTQISLLNRGLGRKKFRGSRQIIVIAESVSLSICGLLVS